MKYREIFGIYVICSFISMHAENDGKIKKKRGADSYSTIFLLNDKQELLLIRRKGTTFADGLYSMPGGKIEAGESALIAAQREAIEEIGITVDDLILVHVIDREGPETGFYIFVFKPQVVHGEPINNEPHKCDDIRWFPLNQIPTNIIPAHRQAIELIQQGVYYGAHGYQ